MKALMAAAGVLLGLASMGAQVVPPDEIALAIEQGRAGKTLQKKCGARGDNGFDIVVEGPMGRIMRVAREARRPQHDMTPAEVTPALAVPVLTVSVRRDPTLRTPYVDARYPYSDSDDVYRSEVVLRSKPSGSAGPILLRPVRPINYNLENAPGYRAVYNETGRPGRADSLRALLPFPGSDMTATFDLAAFKAMPPGNVEVVIFTGDAGEHRCKISDKERRAIR